jgi:hypothetical protein
MLTPNSGVGERTRSRCCTQIRDDELGSDWCEV